MKICAISDTHNQHNAIDVGSGDIIIHAGDCTGRGGSFEIQRFVDWYSNVDYTHKILIAGNHDFGFERDGQYFGKMCKSNGIVYLNDTNVTINGIKIHGSPITPEFYDWAFNRSIDENNPSPTCREKHRPIQPHWDLIPEDVDILVTHGPPYGIMDLVNNGMQANVNVGCPLLKRKIDAINPKLHIFGHIHEQQGIVVNKNTIFCNASQLDDRYRVKYKPKVFEWENGKIKI